MVTDPQSKLYQSETRQLYSAIDAARLLGVDASWLLKSARERRIPFVQLGKYVRFDVDELIGHCTKLAKPEK